MTFAAGRGEGLVLSVFPGGGLADYAFEQEGYCIVRGPDPLWGGDIRTFHPPPGRFDGIIGGDPCQSHSSLANLVRAKGLKPSFPDMTPDFQRVIEEAQPVWFLRENVPKAPDIKPAGYDVRSFLLDNSTLDSGDGTGNEQMRRRRFWFGTRDVPCPELRAFMDFALYELPDAVTAISCDGRTGHRVNDGPGGTVEGHFRARQQAVAGDARSVPVAMGGSGKRKVTADGGHDGHSDAINHSKRRKDRTRAQAKSAPLPGRNEGAVGAPGKDYSPPRRTLEEMQRLQGLPEDWFKHQPWTMSAKRKIVGNGWSVPMARQLARAIREALP